MMDLERANILAVTYRLCTAAGVDPHWLVPAAPSVVACGVARPGQGVEAWQNFARAAAAYVACGLTDPLTGRMCGEDFLEGSA